MDALEKTTLAYFVIKQDREIFGDTLGEITINIIKVEFLRLSATKHSV